MSNQENIFQSVTKYLSLMFLLQGLSLIGLGVIIFLRPATLFVLVIIAFIWMGISALVSSFKIRKFGKDVTADIMSLNK